GKIVLVKEPTRVADFVAAAVETVQPLLEQKRQKLELDVDASLIVRGDSVRLTQIVGNLLHNAAKYTEEDGRISLTAGERGGRAELVVKDSGIGLAPEAMPRIFELFTQIQSDRTTSSDGLGIGLALVRALVELHGGEIQASSPGVGQGSEFTVRIPTARAE